MRCPSDTSKCEAGTDYCTVNQVSGAPYCAKSCLRHNSGCGQGEVCLSVPKSGCGSTSGSDCSVVNRCYQLSGKGSSNLFVAFGLREVKTIIK